MIRTHTVPTRSPAVRGALLLLAFTATVFTSSATSNPAAVTIVGSFQTELGCSGDWQPDCSSTHLSYDATDAVWQGTFTIPAGNYEYKAALNDSWDENYGANAQTNGANLSLNLSSGTAVKFYYDRKTNWIADNKSNVIAVVPGNFQSELGCPGDWQPDCLRSWLQDPDGDGLFSFTATLPAGDYETKVAIGESWNENYGAEGVPNGANIPFTVPADCAEMLFEYNESTHVLTISPAPPLVQPTSITIAGSLQSELGCSGDWQPACATHLTYDADDSVWQGVFDVPAGSWDYKAALNDSWDESYGANAQNSGANLSLNLSSAAAVKFYYDHKTHWVADNNSTVIATAPGSYQSQLGCPGDWQPDCLRSWLQDPDGDGIFSFTANLPAGNYETKVAIGESWSENYGAGGERDGANVPFNVAACCAETLFRYDANTHVLTVMASPAIAISTVTNGEDADLAPGPAILVGDAVNWTYIVTNTGNSTLTDVTVTDDQGVSVTCPESELASGESMTCTAAGTATAGVYTNVGTVSATSPSGSPLTATDPSHYEGAQPSIAIEVRTNGEDADFPPGPSIVVGSSVNWTYVVTNTGDVALFVDVLDDRLGAPSCPKWELEAGESMTCTANGTAVTGQYANLGTATGLPRGLLAVTATDPGHYVGVSATWSFTGFFPPVDNPPTINQLRAGSAVPVKFSLGGDRGLAIFAPGYPLLRSVPCPAGSPTDAIDQVVSASTSGLEYDAATGVYTYVWKTNKGLTGCGELVLGFAEGPQATALFNLR